MTRSAQIIGRSVLVCQRRRWAGIWGVVRVSRVWGTAGDGRQKWKGGGNRDGGVRRSERLEWRVPLGGTIRRWRLGGYGGIVAVSAVVEVLAKHSALFFLEVHDSTTIIGSYWPLRPRQWTSSPFLVHNLIPPFLPQTVWRQRPISAQVENIPFVVQLTIKGCNAPSMLPNCADWVGTCQLDTFIEWAVRCSRQGPWIPCCRRWARGKDGGRRASTLALGLGFSIRNQVHDK